jgi:hypothetical protein
VNDVLVDHVCRPPRRISMLDHRGASAIARRLDHLGCLISSQVSLWQGVYPRAERGPEILDQRGEATAASHARRSEAKPSLVLDWRSDRVDDGHLHRRARIRTRLADRPGTTAMRAPGGRLGGASEYLAMTLPLD